MKTMNMQIVQALKALKGAAKTGGLFFYLMLWMTWLLLTRQRRMV
ncbi:MAG TPA: hypothetical protein VJW20_07800 [Candidatus Angelobacter sp.]|nr:hypothetical protein [Candidatus Angelobacter sp.]